MAKTVYDVVKDCDDIDVLRDVKRQIQTGNLRVDDLPIMGGPEHFPLKDRVIDTIDSRIEGIKAERAGIRTSEPLEQTEAQKELEVELFKGTKKQLKHYKRDAREFLRILIEATEAEKEVHNIIFGG